MKIPMIALGMLMSMHCMDAMSLREPREPENPSTSQQVYISNAIQPNPAIPVPRDVYIRNMWLYGKLNNQPTKTLYVDINSTSPGGPDGSFYNPFISIQSAVNAIIANGDNANYDYRIHVAPGTYMESLSFNNPNIYSIGIFSEYAILAPQNGNSITSTTYNGQIQNLIFDGMLIQQGDIIISGTTPLFSGDIGCQFSNCLIGGNLTLTNVQACNVLSSACTATITLNNVVGPDSSAGFFFVGGNGHVGGDLVLTNSSFVIYQNTAFENGSVNISDPQSQIIVQNCLFTNAGSLTIVTGGKLTTYGSFLGATSISNSGTLDLYGSFLLPGAITGAGSLGLNNSSQLIDYATTSTVWASPRPTTVYQALNRLANVVGGSTPIP